MNRYTIKVVFNFSVIAENETDASGAIQELDYNFLETTGAASLERFEMEDYFTSKPQKLNDEEERK